MQHRQAAGVTRRYKQPYWPDMPNAIQPVITVCDRHFDTELHGQRRRMVAQQITANRTTLLLIPKLLVRECLVSF